ncbi:EF-hand calcium-binding domain-containing protein 5 [Clonorchis sinensis]|uniref:EF-hand calcium-binding domain-containing protein 5 n=1 Tax=Clonorchis sinensis TaxID=79923 RepID=G7Y804_CLOSI|nr:EF-hand calcium-binding domain-containing protein 5 [Clonorchis sinensis]
MPSRLTLAQFLRMMECFVKDNASDEVVQKLVLYLKKNYTEASEWQENYCDKFREMRFEEESSNVIARLFEIMDYKSTGFVHLSLVEQYVAHFEDGSFRDSLECAKRKIQTFQSKRAQEYLVCNEQLDFSMGDRAMDEPSACESNSFQGKTPPLMDNANDTANTLIDRQNLRILLRHTFSVNRVGENQSNLEILSAFADFVKRQMNVSLQEKLKGDTRRQWLDAITHEARIAHYSMEPVYRAVFKAIIRNTLTFSGNKPISAKIFLLQKMGPSSGKTTLQCMAAIPDSEATSSVGEHLLGTHANICFQAMDYGCPMYEKIRVSQSCEAEPGRSNMSSKPETLTCSEQTTPHQNVGLAVPISNPTRRSLGVLYIRQPCDDCKHLMLEEDELSFYQAIANQLGSAIDTVNLHKFFTHTVVAAFHWINQYLDSMEQVVYYWCLDKHKANAARQTARTLGDADEDEKQNIDQQSVKHRNCALVRLVTKHRNSAPVLHAKPQVLERSESYLDNYLFTVADTSEVVEQTSCQKHHFCYPVRDCEGVAVGIVDLCMNENKLSTEETEKVITMMAILSTVYGSQNRRLGTEVYQGRPEEGDVDFGGEIAFSPSSFFKQVAAIELYELVRKLTPEVYNQIHSCASSSQVVLDIIAMVAEVLNPPSTDSGGNVNTVDDQCRSIERLLPGFNVTSTSNERHVIMLHRFFESHPATKVKYEIPYPVQLLYQWLRCYISLLEVIGSSD